jgi:predicted small secreted protein
VEKIKTLWAEKKALVIGVGIAIITVVVIVVNKVRKPKTFRK